MGIFDKLLKKNTESKEAASEMPQEESLVYGVEDVFNLIDSDDVVVVGIAKGTVKPGMVLILMQWEMLM